jgi:hypothetical protein
MNTVVIEVQKEEIHLLAFPVDDVLIDEELRRERSRMLHAATCLGNIEKHKVAIHFEDVAGRKVVHTTIWAVTEKNIIMKGGKTIPIHRIYHVDFL